MSTNPDWWMIPMKVKRETLRGKHTWDLVKLPPGVNIMNSMWVYDIKWDGEGNQIKDKSRVVGKGYTQQLGVDYNETWAGVTCLKLVWMMVAIAAKHDLKLWRINFVGAYLSSLLKEDIYIKQPEGFIEPGFKDYVCKLIHTIYGTLQGVHNLVQDPQQNFWQNWIHTSHVDPCVCFKKDNGNYRITDTNTDNVFGASNTEEEGNKRKKEIREEWEIKDVGEMEYFLGMQVQQNLDKGTIQLTQWLYWEHVINRFALESVVSWNVPLPPGITLDSNMSPKTESKRENMKDKPYCPILSSVMWGQLATWPDLSFLVSLLAQFQSNPSIDHWNALMHVIGYIKNTLNYRLTYSCDFELTPSVFVDADYGGCKDTWHLTSRYIFTMAGGVVTWSSKHQETVALSTVEVEYIAMSQCTQQMAWMQSWLDEVEIECSWPGVIKGDSQGAIALMKNTKDHGKVKHINIQHHYIWELIQSRTIQTDQVSSADNLADLQWLPKLPQCLHVF